MTADKMTADKMISDKLTAWGESHRGFVRKINQDRFLIKKTDDLLILAVADGMGGACRRRDRCTNCH